MADETFQFSQHTVKQLEAIEGITPIIRRLRQICALVIAAPDITAPGVRKKELKRLLSRLEELTKAMHDLSGDSYLDLINQSKLSTERVGERYRLDNWIQMQRETAMLVLLVSQTLDKVQTKPGRLGKHKARMLALHTALQFRMRKIPLSSYESGPYMKVLELLFKDLFRDKNNAGFTRHGRWAIEQLESV